MKRFRSSYLTLFFAGWLSVIAITIFHLMNNQEQGAVAGAFQGYFYLVVLALWIRKDAAKRRIGFPADLAMLNGYLLPIYVLHSRGWKGCGILVLILMIFFAGLVAAAFYFDW